MSQLIQDIATSLKHDNTGNTRNYWVNYLIQHNVPLLSICELLFFEKPVSNGFIWMVGGLCEIDPDRVAPAVDFLFQQLGEVNFKNYERSLAKIFYWVGLPTKMESQAIDLLFEWLIDPKMIVSTKTFAMLAIFKITKAYPELKNELKIVIEDQVEFQSVSFRKKAVSILEML